MNSLKNLSGIDILNTLVGITSLIITIVVMIKTNGIKKELRKVKAKRRYHLKHVKYRETFMGYINSITVDNLHTRQIVNDICALLIDYKGTFGEVFNYQDHCSIRKLMHELEKEYEHLDFPKIVKYLRKIVGRLYKEED